jgi:hypothetical protein
MATVLGFLLMTALVVALATSSTARYEFERNGAREPQRAGAAGYGAHPAGSRAGRRSPGAAETQEQPQAVDVAVRPVPAPTAGGTGWWLIDETGQALAGPFADRVDADWAALADALAAVPVHGSRGVDGAVTLRPSPEERAWLAELGDQLDRIPAEWDGLLTDTDPLTTLLVEVAAALVEAGLPLDGSPEGSSAGGVSLMPEATEWGVLVSWRTHDRLSLHQARGGAASATVQHSMNAAIAEILVNLGFVVEPSGAMGASLVTALR